MKTCSKCKQKVSLRLFCRDSSKKDGLHPHCRKCRSKQSKKYREDNREVLNKRAREYRKNNLEEIRVKDIVRNKCSKRKAYRNSRNRYYLVKERSLGKLFQKDTEAIYKDCLWLNEFSKEKYEVDHIIPIKVDMVCGLHVPWNLEIISRFKNRSKGNKY
jgi:hypothetical protein